MTCPQQKVQSLGQFLLKLQTPLPFLLWHALYCQVLHTRLKLPYARAKKSLSLGLRQQVRRTCLYCDTDHGLGGPLSSLGYPTASSDDFLSCLAVLVLFFL